MFKNLLLNDKEHAFLLDLLVAIREEHFDAKPSDSFSVMFNLTVPERMDLNEIIKRLMAK
jgi:hypothetical protein